VLPRARGRDPPAGSSYQGRIECLRFRAQEIQEGPQGSASAVVKEENAGLFAEKKKGRAKRRFLNGDKSEQGRLSTEATQREKAGECTGPYVGGKIAQKKGTGEVGQRLLQKLGKSGAERNVNPGCARTSGTPRKDERERFQVFLWGGRPPILGKKREPRPKGSTSITYAKRPPEEEEVLSLI